MKKAVKTEELEEEDADGDDGVKDGIKVEDGDTE